MMNDAFMAGGLGLMSLSNQRSYEASRDMEFSQLRGPAVGFAASSECVSV